MKNMTSPAALTKNTFGYRREWQDPARPQADLWNGCDARTTHFRGCVLLFLEGYRIIQLANLFDFYRDFVTGFQPSLGSCCHPDSLRSTGKNHRAGE